MDELSREKLYSQLEEMVSANVKENAKPLISKEDFLKLSDADKLKYLFRYRDEQTEFKDGMEYYIELPNMNLENQDLSGLYLSKFHVSISGEKGNIVPSIINLKDTEAVINITGIGPNDVQNDENNIQNYITDFSKINFIGCDIIGRLPDEIDEIQNPNFIIATTNKEKGLPIEYIERREEHKLTPEQKSANKRAYNALAQFKGLKGFRGRDKIDFTDYDLSDIDIAVLIRNVENYNIELENVGIAPVNKDVLEKLRTELSLVKYYLLLKKIEHEDLRCSTGTLNIEDSIIEFLSSIKYHEATEEYPLTKSGESYETPIYRLMDEIMDLDEAKALMCSEALEMLSPRDTIYCKWERDNGEWNKYEIELEDTIAFDYFEKVLQNEFEQGDLEFSKQYFKFADEETKEKIIEKACIQGDLEFTKQYLGYAGEETQKKIIENTYKQGDLEFAKRYLKYAGEETQKKIIEDAYKQGDLKFAQWYFEYAGEETQKRIVENAYKQDDLKFAQRHFEHVGEESQKKIIENTFKQGDTDWIISNYLKLHDLESTNNNISFLLNIPQEVAVKYIDKLQERYEDLSKYDISKVLVFSPEETLEKKMILDACSFNLNEMEENRRFPIAISILITNVSDMYARYNFLKEQNIEIDPSKLEETLLITPKGFIRKYGEQVISQEEKEKLNLEEKAYAIVVKQRLREKYPLPKSIDEMKGNFQNKEELIKDKEEK